MTSKAQSALEYLMIVALTMGIIIPAAYFFFQYSSESSTQIVDAQINQIGRNVIDTAETVYFSGEGSKMVLEMNMPKNLEDVYILAKRELVFKITSDVGVTEAVFFSSVSIPIAEDGELSDIAGSGLKKIKIQSVADGKGGTEIRIGKFSETITTPVGCSDGTVEQTVSANMVGCQKACDTSVAISISNLALWNNYWKTACGTGWHICTGTEAINNNNGCSGNWNNNYALSSTQVWTYWVSCGSGQSAAYTVTQSGTSCSNDNVLNGLSSAGWTDGIYGGFTVGPPTCSSYGSIGFGVHSHYPGACDMNFCNTCASGYGPQAGGTLCCKD